MTKGNHAEAQSRGEPPFAIGAVVRLKSGSPRMMVVDYPGSGAVTVAWRNPDGKVHEINLPAVTLCGSAPPREPSGGAPR